MSAFESLFHSQALLSDLGGRRCPGQLDAPGLVGPIGKGGWAEGECKGGAGRIGRRGLQSGHKWWAEIEYYDKHDCVFGVISILRKQAEHVGIEIPPWFDVFKLSVVHCRGDKCMR